MATCEQSLSAEETAIWNQFRRSLAEGLKAVPKQQRQAWLAEKNPPLRRMQEIYVEEMRTLPSHQQAALQLAEAVCRGEPGAPANAEEFAQRTSMTAREIVSLSISVRRRMAARLPDDTEFQRLASERRQRLFGRP